MIFAIKFKTVRCTERIIDKNYGETVQKSFNTHIRCDFM